MPDIPPFLWQSALILLLAYFLGAWLGCLLRRFLTRPPKVAMAGSAATSAAAAAGGAPVSRATDAELTDRFGRALQEYKGDASRPQHADQPGARSPEPPPRPPVERMDGSAAAGSPARETERGPDAGTTDIAAALAAARAASRPVSEGVNREAGPDSGPSSAHEPPRPPAAAEPQPSLAARLEKIPERQQAQNAGGSARQPEAGAASEPAERRTDEREHPQAIRPGSQPPPRTDAPEEATGGRNVSASGVGGQASVSPRTPAERPTSEPASEKTAERAVPAESERSPGSGLAAAAVAAAAAAATAATAGGSAVRPAAPVNRPAPASSGNDNLRLIDGITEADAAVLRGAGVTTFRQVAAWTRDDLDKLPESLGGRRRISQQNWIEQAALLARGTPTAHIQRLRQSRAGAAASPPVQPAMRDATQPGASTPRLRPVSAVPSGTPPAASSRPAQQGQSPAGPPRPVQQNQSPAAARADPAAPRIPEVPASAADSPASPAPAEEKPSATAALPPAAIEGFRSVRSRALLGRTGASADGPDDLKRIRGIGVLLEKRLNTLGYTRYAQIAAWKQADIDRVNQQLDFSGRIERENWIEQARILATGGQTEFSRRQDRSGG